MKGGCVGGIYRQRYPEKVPPLGVVFKLQALTRARRRESLGLLADVFFAEVPLGLSQRAHHPDVV